MSWLRDDVESIEVWVREEADSDVRRSLPLQRLDDDAEGFADLLRICPFRVRRIRRVGCENRARLAASPSPARSPWLRYPTLTTSRPKNPGKPRSFA
jgi:hypothetical protein